MSYQCSVFLFSEPPSFGEYDGTILHMKSNLLFLYVYPAYCAVVMLTQIRRVTVLPAQLRTGEQVPQGLEYLARLDQVLIKQQVELLEGTWAP